VSHALPPTFAAGLFFIHTLMKLSRGIDRDSDTVAQSAAHPTADRGLQKSALAPLVPQEGACCSSGCESTIHMNTHHIFHDDTHLLQS